MIEFKIYLLKSILCLIVLYLFYWFALKNENKYLWNRIYLLASLVSSLMVPFFYFSLKDSSSALLTNVFDPLVIEAGKEPLETVCILHVSQVNIVCNGAISKNWKRDANERFQGLDLQINHNKGETVGRD